jgi:hypothetical protein
MGLFSRKPKEEAAEPVVDPQLFSLKLTAIGPVLPSQPVGAAKALMDIAGAPMGRAKALVSEVSRGGEVLVLQSADVAALEAHAAVFGQVGALTRIDPPTA